MNSRADNILHRVYFNATLVDPVCLIILGLMCIWMIMASRRQACWPMIVIACFIAQAQRLSPFGVDFTFLRIITIVGLARVLMRDEFKGFKWNNLDTSVIVFMVVKLIWAVLHITKGGGVSPQGVLGEMVDMWGAYFFFRAVVRDFEDLRWVMYGFILVSVPNAALFVVEYTTLHNPFAFMGGVSDLTRVRDGKLRCMGAYSHPILGGCFWAALLPYMGAMIRKNGRITIIPFIGIAAASVMMILSGSSSPIAAAGLAFVGGCAFIIRKRMRIIRWFTFIFCIGVQMLAANPIWHVFARVQILGGSTGYYRFKLIDMFIRHFGEWWLAGSARGTTTWQVQMFDIVNYYVSLGLSGGLVFVVLLILILVLAFQNAGKAIRSANGNVEMELWGWATGVAVFVHLMNFMVVTYYGQIIMVWFFALAVTSVRNPNSATRTFSVATGRFTADSLSRLAAKPSVPYQQPVRFSRW